MKKTAWMTMAAVGLAVSAWAQGGGAVVVRETLPHLESHQAPDNLHMAVPVHGKITRGAPYSADTMTEAIQTLADGNRIVRRTATRVFRDSQGRTRTERLNDLGVVTSISISDPVSGETLMLNPETRTAYRGGVITITTSTGGLITHQEVQGGVSYRIDEKTALDAAKRQQIEDQARLTAGGGGALVVTQHVTAGQAVDEAKRQLEEQVWLTAGVLSHVTEDAGRVKVTNENLGQQTIEGVLATGTRTTTVIEAGAIGNEQPIRSVSEQWFSPDLHTLVLTSHSDPRTGETTFRLTNIVRAEPDRSLFLLPPGYTLKESAIRRESL